MWWAKNQSQPARIMSESCGFNGFCGGLRWKEHSCSSLRFVIKDSLSVDPRSGDAIVCEGTLMVKRPFSSFWRDTSILHEVCQYSHYPVSKLMGALSRLNNAQLVLTNRLEKVEMVLIEGQFLAVNFGTVVFFEKRLITNDWKVTSCVTNTYFPTHGVEQQSSVVKLLNQSWITLRLLHTAKMMVRKTYLVDSYSLQQLIMHSRHLLLQ